MCKVDRVGHIFRSLVGRITEHHTLIAGTGVQIVFEASFFCLQCFVDTHCDVCGLLVKCDHDSTGVAVKAGLCIVVADLIDGLTYDGRNVQLCLGGNLTGHKDESRTGCGFARNTAHRILCHAGIQNRVGYSITDFIRMAFGNRFGSK